MHMHIRYKLFTVHVIHVNLVASIRMLQVTTLKRTDRHNQEKIAGGVAEGVGLDLDAEIAEVHEELDVIAVLRENHAG